MTNRFHEARGLANYTRSRFKKKEIWDMEKTPIGDATMQLEEGVKGVIGEYGQVDPVWCL